MKKTFFSDFFEVDKEVMKKHGVFNISLIADTPAFIDPFNLYCSPKKSYQEAHSGIIEYVKFLCKISKSKRNIQELKKKYFYFKEPSQNWLGYTKYGNAGYGLRQTFADSLFENMSKYMQNFGYEEITDSSHIEKLFLFDEGFSMDSVSDFTTRLIYPFLLAYTENFSREYINRKYCKTHMVENAYFDFQKKEWCSKEYYLPTFKEDDYIILVPEDILVQDELFICCSGLVEYLKYAKYSDTTSKFVDHINEYISDIISEELSAEDRKKKLNQLIREYPVVLDYYIKSCEERSEEAVVNNKKLVAELNQVFNINCKALIELLQFQSDFYKYDDIDDMATIIRRLNILKDTLETPDGTQFLYLNGKPIKTDFLEMLFNRVWFAGKPKEATKQFVPYNLEFKCAANSPIEDNLHNRFIKADNKINILCYVYFTDDQYKRLVDALRKLKLAKNENIILIDAIRG